MTNKRALAIILKDYPFKAGEPYFERELQALASSFPEVFLFSRHINQHVENPHFDIPKNVKVINISSTQTLKSRIKTVIATIFNGVWIDILQDFRIKGLAINWSKLKIILAYEDERRRIIQAIKIAEKDLQRPIKSFIWYSYWCDEAAYLLARLKQTGEIDFAFSRVHNFDIYEERQPFGYIPYRQFIADHLNEVWCISSHGKSYLELRYPSLKHKFLLYRLGVNVQSPIPSSPRSPFIIISISHIVPIKNLETIIEALSKWDNQPLHWYHFGDGDNKNYVEVIKKLAVEKLSWNSKVKFTFLGGISHELILDRIRNLNPHVLVNASLFEGVPVSMMEAASLGIPIIGPSVCGVPEIVFNGINGYTFPPNKADELFFNLRKLASMDEQEYENFRKHSLQVHSKNFDADLNYMSLIDRLKVVSKKI